MRHLVLPMRLLGRSDGAIPRACCGPPRPPSARNRSTPDPRRVLQPMPNRPPMGTRDRRESGRSGYWGARGTRPPRQWPTPIALAILVVARVLRVALLGRTAHLQAVRRKPPPYLLRRHKPPAIAAARQQDAPCPI